MTLEDGRATNLYISVQPSGAIFETPLEISFPNADHLPANSEVLLMSFDHDAGRYVRVGTGHVTADGREVKSDPAAESVSAPGKPYRHRIRNPKSLLLATSKLKAILLLTTR